MNKVGATILPYYPGIFMKKQPVGATARFWDVKSSLTLFVKENFNALTLHCHLPVLYGGILKNKLLQ